MGGGLSLNFIGQQQIGSIFLLTVIIWAMPLPVNTFTLSNELDKTSMLRIFQMRIQIGF